MKTTIVAFIALLFAFSVEASTQFHDLRCDLYVVSLGAPKSEVLRKCGEPFNVENWDEERLIQDYIGFPVQSDYVPLLRKEYVRIEQWEYNFGPMRFLYYLRFENGVLTGITAGDYGY